MKKWGANAIAMMFVKPASSLPVVHFLPGLVIIVFAAVLCLPCLLVGIPSGANSTTHAMYQYHFSHQFWEGDFYPRWLAEANKGFGSPVFLVQYPFPYFITALLRPILSLAPTDIRESRELGVYCFLVLAGAGLSGWVWFRNRCTPVASTFAAGAYISLPYIMGQVLYGRAAIGELTTFVWMPLMLALCDRVQPRRFGVLSAIALVFALLVLSNILYAVLFVPIVVLYAGAAGKQTVLPVIVALAFGICIAAVYVFPLIAYQGFFDPGAMITNHVLAELGRNLIYISSIDMQRRITVPAIIAASCMSLIVAWQICHRGGGLIARLGMLLILGLGMVLLVPGVGPALIKLSSLKVSGFDSYAGYSVKMLVTALFTLGLGFLAHCRISREQTDPRDHALLLISCGAFALMLPWSAGIWSSIPKTAIIQFPWQICAILTVAAAGLFAVALDDCLRSIRSEKRPSPLLMIFFALAVIGAGNIIWRVDIGLRSASTARVDVTRWVDMMYVTYVPSPKLAEFAQAVGTSPDTFDVIPTPVEKGVHAEFVGCEGDASVTRVEARKILVSARCHGDARMKIGQLYFPLWTIVPMKGFHRDEALGSSTEGLIEVSLDSGQHEFELVFGDGLPENGGAILTTASILVLVGGFVFAVLRPHSPDDALSFGTDGAIQM